MLLYRAIGEAERHDLVTSGVLRPGENSCEGKHFAVTRADATKWGSSYYQDLFWVICVKVDDDALREWMCFDYDLDGIGRAYFADAGQLSVCECVEIYLIDHRRK